MQPAINYFELIKEAIAKGSNLFITGTAGSGKSYLLNQLKEHYKDDIQLTASTGISALNIKGVTIHSWARLGIGNKTPSQIAASIKKDSKIAKRIKECKYLAIDEISMISSHLLDLLSMSLKIFKKSSKPFGGIQILLFGDFLQLPPVLKDGETSCLDCYTWKEAKVKTIFLRTNYRQAEDKEFYNLLQSVRNGENIPEVCDILKTRVVSSCPKDITRLVTHRAMAKEINEAFLAELTTESQTYQGKYSGTEEVINCHKPQFQEQEVLTLKIGSKVMLTYNLNLEGGLVNGLLGTVISFNTNNQPLVKFQNSATISVGPFSWEIEERVKAKDGTETDKVVFVFSQLPLMLANAISIHKAQGLTFDSLYLDISRCFEKGQAYVALSRVKSLEGLYLAPFSKNSIKTDFKVVEYYKTLEGY